MLLIGASGTEGCSSDIYAARLLLLSCPFSATDEADKKLVEAFPSLAMVYRQVPVQFALDENGEVVFANQVHRLGPLEHSHHFQFAAIAVDLEV